MLIGLQVGGLDPSGRVAVSALGTALAILPIAWVSVASAATFRATCRYYPAATARRKEAAAVVGFFSVWPVVWLQFNAAVAMVHWEKSARRF